MERWNGQNTSNLDVDSNEELYIVWWLEELRDNGYVVSYERCVSFVLSDNIQLTKTKKQKKGCKQVIAQLLSGHNYTPDFKVFWHETAIGVFVSLNLDLPLNGFWENGKLISYVEVKPAFDQNNMTRLFKINQKWIYQVYHIFINLIVPIKLFEKTFVPKRFLFTNKTNKLRKTELSYRSLSDYVAGDKDRTGINDVVERV